MRPSRTEGNTRLYSEEDLEQLETILSLTRDLGVNLAGVEIILNMRRRITQMQAEVNEFMAYVKKELARGIDDWEQRLSTALVKSAPTDLYARIRQRHRPSRLQSRSLPRPADARRACRPLEILRAVSRMRKSECGVRSRHSAFRIPKLAPFRTPNSELSSPSALRIPHFVLLSF